MLIIDKDSFAMLYKTLYMKIGIVIVWYLANVIVIIWYLVNVIVIVWYLVIYRQSH